MTPQQMIEFDARREAILRRQLKTNPKFRAMRRNKRLAIAAGIVRYAASVAIALFLIKAFVISQSGVSGYLEMVAPVTERLPQDGVLAGVFAPDAYSNQLASLFASLVQQDEAEMEQASATVERVGPDLSGR
jgi:hypothetical protein